MTDGTNLVALKPTDHSDDDAWDRPSQAPTKPGNCWDFGGWGDAKTWMTIFALCIFGLAIAAISWALPHGRDAAVPPIHIY